MAPLANEVGKLADLKSEQWLRHPWMRRKMSQLMIHHPKEDDDTNVVEEIKDLALLWNCQN